MRFSRFPTRYYITTPTPQWKAPLVAFGWRPGDALPRVSSSMAECPVSDPGDAGSTPVWRSYQCRLPTLLPLYPTAPRRKGMLVL